MHPVAYFQAARRRPRSMWFGFAGVCLALATMLTGCGGSDAMSRTAAPASVFSFSTLSKAPQGSRTIVIVLENREFDEVIGASNPTYLSRLASEGALAVNYHAIRHPSLPNYLALIGGSTFGITEDCSDCRASGSNLATQLSTAGVSWRAYMGGMPSACFTGAEVGDYAKKHNPFMYFPSVTSNPSLCARDVPGGRLQSDLSSRRLPTFAWISPDLCEDAHSCGFNTADQYLRRLVPLLLRQLGPSGLLAITFDEGTTDAGCCNDPSGGRIATVLLGPKVRKGARLRGAYSHYSLLATLEDRLGVSRLRHAREADALGAAFRAG